MYTENLATDNGFFDLEVPSEVLDASSFSGAITIPKGDFLVQADFSRQGDDLLLQESGESILVRDYFAQEQMLDLVTEFGARISPELATRLAGSLAPGMYAANGDTVTDAGGSGDVGVIEAVEGSATITRSSGIQLAAKTGTPLFEGDIIESDAGSSVGMGFNDDSTFSLGGNGRMVVESMQFDAKAEEGHSEINVVSGVFSFISGGVAKLGPDSMVVKTPVVTIGIRGTKVAGLASAEGSENSITLLEQNDGFVGKIALTNQGGTVLLSQANQSVSLSSFFQPPPKPITLSQAEVNARYGAAFKVLPTRPSQQDHTRSKTKNKSDDNSGEAQAEGDEEVAAEDGEGEESAEGTEEITEEVEEIEELMELATLVELNENLAVPFVVPVTIAEPAVAESDVTTNERSTVATVDDEATTEHETVEAASSDTTTTTTSSDTTTTDTTTTTTQPPLTLRQLPPPPPPPPPLTIPVSVRFI